MEHRSGGRGQMAEEWAKKTMGKIYLLCTQGAEEGALWERGVRLGQCVQIQGQGWGGAGIGAEGAGE